MLYRELHINVDLYRIRTITLVTTSAGRLCLFRIDECLLWWNVCCLHIVNAQIEWLLLSSAIRWGGRERYRFSKVWIMFQTCCQLKINRKVDNILIVLLLKDICRCYPCPLTVACKLTSGVCVLELSDVSELADDKEDKTSETGATPSDESISSRSL